MDISKTSAFGTPPVKLEQCSETSAHKIQTPGNHPKERVQQSVVFLPNVTLSVTWTDTIVHRRTVRHSDPTEYEYYFG